MWNINVAYALPKREKIFHYLKKIKTRYNFLTIDTYWKNDKVFDKKIGRRIYFSKSKRKKDVL